MNKSTDGIRKSVMQYAETTNLLGEWPSTSLQLLPSDKSQAEISRTVLKTRQSEQHWSQFCEDELGL